MISTIKKRLAEERGFTLLELLITIIVMAILATIAVPAYLSYRDRANVSAAQANIRAAVPGIEDYSARNVGTATDSDANAATTGYAGMTLAGLQATDLAIKGIAVVSASMANYCVKATSGSKTYYKTQSTVISTTVCT